MCSLSHLKPPFFRSECYRAWVQMEPGLYPAPSWAPTLTSPGRPCNIEQTLTPLSCKDVLHLQTSQRHTQDLLYTTLIHIKRELCSECVLPMETDSPYYPKASNPFKLLGVKKEFAVRFHSTSCACSM